MSEWTERAAGVLGKIQNDGTVTLTWNVQGVRLLGPGGKQWLPCEICGGVDAVDLNVISHVCGTCFAFPETFDVPEEG